MTTITKLKPKAARKLARRVSGGARRPFGACPFGLGDEHDYSSGWESQREGVADGVMFCSKCGDVRRMRPFVPLDDR